MTSSTAIATTTVNSGAAAAVTFGSSGRSNRSGVLVGDHELVLADSAGDQP